MSYQVLARKWRPKKFQELMGQEHVVNVLVNALSQQRLHHAYLFTGTRGVGKTTIARIFAKSLNCLSGITTEPCGTCDACQDIDQGRFVDLLEIDAASRTKVDDTREILDNVQYAPSRGRYKVYLIDEVHMLSRSSFNALLKTLEEPPEHVKFILATTDPQKLPVTVLSRCLQFHLKALTQGQIKEQLSAILSAENVTIDDNALSLLARAARGSMRDGLSLTDQALAQGQGEISAANVQQMLGGVDQNWSYKILILLIKKDLAGLMSLSLDIASYAPNYSRLLAELIQLLHQVAIAQVVKGHFDLSPEHEKLLIKFTQAMSPEDVQLYYQIALNGRKDLPYAMDEQAAFDMTLLRLSAFQPKVEQSIVANENNLAGSITGSEEPTTAVDFSDVELASTNVTKSDANDDINLPDNAINTVDNSASLSSSPTPAVNQLPEKNTRPQEVAIQETVTQGVRAEENTVQANVEQGFSEQASSEPVTIEPETIEPETVEQENLLTQQMAEIEAAASAQGFNANASTDSSVNEEIIQEPAQTLTQPELSSASINTNDAVSPSELQTEPQQAVDTANLSPVEAILASRNMLRSRKKQLEKTEKKPDDASQRPIQPPVAEKPKDVPELVEGSEQAYTPEIIDPATIKSANQVDKWANMIDHMALNGRLRQLAIHATISQQSNDDHLILELNQSTKHLQSEAAHQQLEAALTQLLARNITVDIQVVAETVADPYQIQSDINSKRYDYAKQLILEDNVVQHLQSQFQAVINEESIVAK